MSRSRLIKCDPRSIDTIPHKNEQQLAKLSHVIDGDTICVVICLGKVLMKISIRISGIDAPETKKSSSELEKKAGEHVSARVHKLIKKEIKDNDLLLVILYNNDKFGGRYVGDVWLSRRNQYLGEFLLHKGYVKAFSGRKKKELWTDEELNNILSL